MTKVLVHPIQRDFQPKFKDVICGLCGRCYPRTGAPPRVLHLVHLVREHLPEVNRTLSRAAQSEHVSIDIEEV